MGEKVIVRGHAGQPHNPEPLMTVTQHERIVAGLEERLRDAEGMLALCRTLLDESEAESLCDRIGAFPAEDKT